MNDTSRMKLQSILSTMGLEAESMALELEESHNRIMKLEEEWKSYADSFSDNEVLFSPRRDRLSKDKLDEKKSILDHALEEYEEQKKKYDQLNDHIEIIVDVLSHDRDGGVHSGLLYQEKDRQRIARDLHELALQNLTYFIEKLDSCIACVDKDPKKVKMDLSMLKTNLSTTIDNIRSVVYDLRPMDFEIASFRQTIESCIERLNEKKEYKIEADIEDIFCDDKLVLQTLYLIIEECLLNIKKHAEAYSIHLIIQEQIGLYYIYIEDDGKGFDLDKESKSKELHFGLSIVRERVALLGGNISIQSAENAGTKIKILVPIPR